VRKKTRRKKKVDNFVP